MRTYKLYASTATGANALASVVLGRNCRVKSIRWAGTIDGAADNLYAYWELSFQPAHQMGTNDTVGPIDELRFYTNFTTSGLMLGAQHVQRNVDVPAAAGERLYLHAALSGSTGSNVTCFIDVDEGRA